jgi:hypothetical protein
VNVLERMKTRWGVGPWGVVAILLAFSLAGMTVIELKKPVLSVLLPDDAPDWVRWSVYILVVLPLYQVVLLIYGTLLGQFRFFWRKLQWMRRTLFGWMMPRQSDASR